MSASPVSSPTTAPARTRPASAWRPIVIGAVAALAVAIGLAAGSFLVTTRVAALGGAASYVPATAVFYLEMRAEPSARQDDALRGLLERFPPIDGVDLSRPLFGQLGEVLDEALADQGTELTWSDDVAPWFDGHVAIALIDLPASPFGRVALDPMAVPETPPMLQLFGVSDAVAARESVERLINEATRGSVSFTTTEHRGVTIHAGEGFGEAAWAITDDQLILGLTADDIAGALDTKAGDSTLAEHDEVTRLTAALPADWLAFGVFDFSSAMSSAFDAADPSERAVSAALGALLEHQPMRGAFTLAATDQGLAVDGVSALPTGPFAVENAERGLAGEVPGDTLYFAEGGTVGPALAAVIGALKEAAGSEPEAAEGLRTAEAALGADLEELVAWIDHGAVSIGWDGAEPYGGLVLVPADQAAAERRLGQLLSFAGLAAFDPSSGISVRDEEIGDVRVTTIRWEPGLMPMPTAGPAALVIQVALTDERALIGFGDRFVARVLDLDPTDALSAQPRFIDAIASLGGPSSTAIGWIDLSGTLAAAEHALASELDDPFYRSDIRPWLLPVDRIVSVSRIEVELHVQRSVLVVE